MLVLLSLLVLAGEGMLRGRGRVSRSGPMAQRVNPPQQLGWARWPVLAAFAALVLLALGLPVASTLYWMADGLPPALSGGANVSLLDAAGHTAVYGGSAAALATVMAFPVALLAIRHRSRARQIRADVQEIFRRAGTTAVLMTHDQDEALSTADQVAVLRDGKIAQCAPPEDLYRRPVSAELAHFIGDANLLEGVLAEGVVKTMLGPLPLDPAAATLRTAGQVTVLIRPEQIDLGPNEDGVTARVTAYRYHGHDAVLHVQPEPDAGAQPVVVRIAGGPHRPVGSTVTLRAHGPVFAWPGGLARGDCHGVP